MKKRVNKTCKDIDRRREEKEENAVKEGVGEEIMQGQKSLPPSLLSSPFHLSAG